MSETQRVFLIIGANRTMRLMKVPRWASRSWWTPPKLKADEIAVAIDVRFPDGWGKVLPTAIAIDVPDDTPAVTADGGDADLGTTRRLGPRPDLVRAGDLTINYAEMERP